MKNEKEILKKLEEIKDLIKKQTKWKRIGDLYFSEDLGEMSWYDAVEKCEELGGRLPTRTELMDLYDNHRDECKDFVAVIYWSSAEYSATYAWLQNFSTGFVNYYNKTNSFYVRCVRTAVSEKLNN